MNFLLYPTLQFLSETYSHYAFQKENTNKAISQTNTDITNFHKQSKQYGTLKLKQFLENEPFNLIPPSSWTPLSKKSFKKKVKKILFSFKKMSFQTKKNATTCLTKQMVPFQSIFEKQSNDAPSVSLMEVISNALDASSPTLNIGHFGKGVKQLLSHIKEEEDKIQITSKKENTPPYQLSIFMKDSELYLSLQELPNQDGLISGTKVELFKHSSLLNTQELQKQAQERYQLFKNAIHWNGKPLKSLTNIAGEIFCPNITPVQVTCDEHYFACQDNGTGMDDTDLLYLFVPIGSDKGHTLKEKDKIGLFSNIDIEQLESLNNFDKVGIARLGETVWTTQLKAEVSLENKSKNETTLTLELGKNVLTDESRRRVLITEDLINNVSFLILKVNDSISFSNHTKLFLINHLYQAILSLVDRSNEHEMNLIDMLKLNIQLNLHSLCTQLQASGVLIIDENLKEKKPSLGDCITHKNIFYLHTDLLLKNIEEKSMEMLQGKKVGIHHGIQNDTYTIYSFPSCYQGKVVGTKKSNGLVFRGKYIILCPDDLIPDKQDPIEIKLFSLALSQTVQTSYERQNNKFEYTCLDPIPQEEPHTNLIPTTDETVHLTCFLKKDEHIVDSNDDSCLVYNLFGLQLRKKNLIDVKTTNYDNIIFSLCKKWAIFSKNNKKTWSPINQNPLDIPSDQWYDNIIFSDCGKWVHLTKNGKQTWWPIHKDPSDIPESRWFDSLLINSTCQWVLIQENNKQTWCPINQNPDEIPKEKWFDKIWFHNKGNWILIQNNNKQTWWPINQNPKEIPKEMWFDMVLLNTEEQWVRLQKNGKQTYLHINDNPYNIPKEMWFDSISLSLYGHWVIIRKGEKEIWWNMNIPISELFKKVPKSEWFDKVWFNENNLYVGIQKNGKQTYLPVNGNPYNIPKDRWFDKVEISFNGQWVLFKEGEKSTWWPIDKDPSNIPKERWFDKTTISDDSQWIILCQNGKQTYLPVNGNPYNIPKDRWFDEVKMKSIQIPQTKYENLPTPILWMFLYQNGKKTYVPINQEPSHLEWYDKIQAKVDIKKRFVVIETTLNNVIEKHYFELPPPYVEKRNQTLQWNLNNLNFLNHIQGFYTLSEDNQNTMKYVLSAVNLESISQEDLEKTVHFLIDCENKKLITPPKRLAFYRYALRFQIKEIPKNIPLNQCLILFSYHWPSYLDELSITNLNQLLIGLGEKAFDFLITHILEEENYGITFLSKLNEFTNNFKTLILETHRKMSILSEREKYKYSITNKPSDLFEVYLYYLTQPNDKCSFEEGLIEKKRKEVNSINTPVYLNQIQTLNQKSLSEKGSLFCLKNLDQTTLPVNNLILENEIKKMTQIQGQGVWPREFVSNALHSGTDKEKLIINISLYEQEDSLVSVIKDNSIAPPNLILLLCQNLSTHSLDGNGAFCFFNGCKEVFLSSNHDRICETVHLVLDEFGWKLTGHSIKPSDQLNGLSLIRVHSKIPQMPIALQSLKEYSHIQKLINSVNFEKGKIIFNADCKEELLNEEKKVWVDLSLYDNQDANPAIQIKIIQGKKIKGVTVQDSNGLHIRTLVQGNDDYEQIFGKVPTDFRKIMEEQGLTFQVKAPLLRSHSGFALTPELKEELQSKVSCALAIYMVLEFAKAESQLLIPHFPEDILYSHKYDSVFKTCEFKRPFSNIDYQTISNQLLFKDKNTLIQTLMQIPFKVGNTWTSLIQIKNQLKGNKTIDNPELDNYLGIKELITMRKSVQETNRSLVNIKRIQNGQLLSNFQKMCQLCHSLEVPSKLSMIQEGWYHSNIYGIHLAQQSFEDISDTTLWTNLAHETTHHYETVLYKESISVCQGIHTHQRDGRFAQIHQRVAQELLLKRKEMKQIEKKEYSELNYPQVINLHIKEQSTLKKSI